MLSSGQDFGKHFFDSKHVLKVYFKPSRKNPDFGFLPLPYVLVWLKKPYILKILVQIKFLSEIKNGNKYHLTSEV